MKLNDKVNFIGEFSIQQLDKNGNLIDEYKEKNLIMDLARNNMAQLVGGVSIGSTGDPINSIVIGTLGHSGGDILSPIPVGSSGFDSTRTALFSEEDPAAINYKIDFDASGGLDVTVNPTGVRRLGTVDQVTSGETTNTVRRVVSDTTVTYTITIPAENANSGGANPVVAYTEAALYAGDDIFSMKTFTGRVKEDTVQFVITWSIIF